jgi:hypothetical protein
MRDGNVLFNLACFDVRCHPEMSHVDWLIKEVRKRAEKQRAMRGEDRTNSDLVCLDNERGESEPFKQLHWPLCTICLRSINCTVQRIQDEP